MATRAQLKPMILPALFLILLTVVIVLQQRGIIDLTKFSLPSSPEFRKFAADLPSIALAFLFGSLGAFVKLSLQGGALAERMRRLIAGGVLGVIVFFILKSKVIPQIMYDNLPTERLEVSYYGLALLAVFAGMYATEVSSWASRRGG